MSIIEVSNRDTSAPRLLTIADVAVLPSQLPSGPADYELDNGRIVIVSPGAARHAVIQSRFYDQLSQQGTARGFGQTWPPVGVVLWRNPDRLVEPDAAFTATRSLPVRETPEGYLESVPNLIVEVRSKNDSIRELTNKAQDYLSAGAELVWVADPLRNVVAAHRRNSEAVDLGMTDVLTADDIIPGFQLAVADVFAA